MVENIRRARGIDKDVGRGACEYDEDDEEDEDGPWETCEHDSYDGCEGYSCGEHIGTYDRRILDEDDLFWLREVCFLGYYPEAPGASKYVISCMDRLVKGPY